MADMKAIMEEMKAIVNEPDQHKDGRAKKKAIFAGALAGLIVGAMIGFAKKWNVGWSALGGAAFGGISAGVITPRD